MVPLASRHCPPKRGLVLVVALAGACSCATWGTPGPTAGDAPAPNFGSADTAPRATFLEYVRRLEFVQDPHLADEQLLVYPAEGAAPRRVGPTARVEPEARSRRLTRRQLAEGRVIARVISDGRYEPLGISRGIQYVWIDSTPSGWRALMIPADAAASATSLSFAFGHVPHLTGAPSAAWYDDPRIGPIFNGGCGGSCCEVCALGPVVCPHLVSRMLRTSDFGGRPGIPPMP